MGKTARASKHNAKMARKRAVKAARRAKYLALRGTSKKTKRQNPRKQRTSGKHGHLMANCGNVGCARCFPKLNPGRLKKAS